MKERYIQEAIVAALAAAGCVVYQTTAWRQRGPSGVTPGIPDLLVHVPGMRQGHLIALEVKGPKGIISPAQQAAFAAGAIAAFVHTPLEAIDAVYTALDYTVPKTSKMRLIRMAEALA